VTADLHTLVGAYALNALTADEQDEFRQHLATCPNCRAELAELRATAARLSDTTWQTPPPEMKTRLMEAVANTPQDRPRVVTLAAESRRRWPSVLLAAAAVLAVLLSLGAYLVERGRLADMESERIAISAVLSAPDVEERLARLPNGGTVRMLMSPSLDRAVVAMDDLPPLEEDQAYQMWRIKRGGPASAAVMSAEESAGSVTRLIDDVAGVEAFAVTVEPAGGSSRPTTKPVVTIELT